MIACLLEDWCLFTITYDISMFHSNTCYGQPSGMTSQVTFTEVFPCRLPMLLKQLLNILEMWSGGFLSYFLNVDIMKVVWASGRHTIWFNSSVFLIGWLTYLHMSWCSKDSSLVHACGNSNDTLSGTYISNGTSTPCSSAASPLLQHADSGVSLDGVLA